MNARELAMVAAWADEVGNNCEYMGDPNNRVAEQMAEFVKSAHADEFVEGTHQGIRIQIREVENRVPGPVFVDVTSDWLRQLADGMPDRTVGWFRTGQLDGKHVLIEVTSVTLQNIPGPPVSPLENLVYPPSATPGD